MRLEKWRPLVIWATHCFPLLLPSRVPFLISLFLITVTLPQPTLIFQPSPTTTSHLPTTSTPTPTSVAAVFFLSEICQLEKTFNTYLFFLLGCIQLRQPSLSCVCQIARQNFQRTPSSINQHAYPPSFIHSAHTARALCCNIPKFDKSLPVLIHQGSLQAVASYRSP